MPFADSNNISYQDQQDYQFAEAAFHDKKEKTRTLKKVFASRHKKSGS